MQFSIYCIRVWVHCSHYGGGAGGRIGHRGAQSTETPPPAHQVPPAAPAPAPAPPPPPEAYAPQPAPEPASSPAGKDAPASTPSLRPMETTTIRSTYWEEEVVGVEVAEEVVKET